MNQYCLVIRRSVFECSASGLPLLVSCCGAVCTALKGKTINLSDQLIFPVPIIHFVFPLWSDLTPLTRLSNLGAVVFLSFKEPRFCFSRILLSSRFKLFNSVLNFRSSNITALKKCRFGITRHKHTLRRPSIWSLSCQNAFLVAAFTQEVELIVY